VISTFLVFDFSGTARAIRFFDCRSDDPLLACGASGHRRIARKRLNRGECHGATARGQFVIDHFPLCRHGIRRSTVRSASETTCALSIADPANGICVICDFIFDCPLCLSRVSV
jgi:hypothetical protein